MKRLFDLRTLALVAAAFASPLAFAHPGHGHAGVASGLAHYFANLDHLLVILALLGLLLAAALVRGVKK